MTSPWHNAPWDPRDWQRKALPKIVEHLDDRPLVRAVMGAGKSILLAELIHHLDRRTVVLTPTQKLVRQLASTFRARGLDVGMYFANAKQSNKQVVVCCNDSLRSLSETIGPPELFVVDEAHKSECDQVKDVILGPQDFQGRRTGGWEPGAIVGFTATPYRADDNERLSLFDRLVFDYGPADAIRDGVVVPPRVLHYEGSSTDTNDACVEMIVGAVRDQLGPGLVDAKTISDANEFSALLNDAGVRTKPVHSKLHNATVEKRLRLLEEGKLDCLVHVQMLSEGVDLPWLRWLCCRRPIASKVLFAQYVGRGLRACEGKTHCTIFDPHDLFGALSLDYEAVIGMGVEELVDLDVMVETRSSSSEGPGETMAGIPVKWVPPAVSYVRTTRLDFQCKGYLRMTLDEARWRSESMTSAQVRKIAVLASTLHMQRDLEQLAVTDGCPDDIPRPDAVKLQTAIAMARNEVLDRGTASDLISVLQVLNRYTWPQEAAEEAA